MLNILEFNLRKEIIIFVHIFVGQIAWKMLSLPRQLFTLSSSSHHYSLHQTGAIDLIRIKIKTNSLSDILQLDWVQLWKPT